MLSRPKRALVIRHVPREGLASFREPIEAAGYQIDRLDVADPAFTSADFLSPDLVILMGGPMGVYEDHLHGWIPHEIERVSQRLDHNLPTLGVCFGAQLIAAALGAKVYPGPIKEIGFAPLQLTAAGQGSPLSNFVDVPVLHWHGDTFDLPHGTELLASSALYAHQAFRRGANLLALQCHPEMGVDPRIDDWLNECEVNEVDLEALRRDYDAKGPRAASAGQELLTQWLQNLADSSASTCAYHSS